MNLSKRDFLQVLGAAYAAGLALGRYGEADAATAERGLYDIAPFGNVSFLHMTDCHAQLKPIYFREPSVNLGLGSMQGQLPHLVGESLLKAAGVRPGTALAGPSGVRTPLGCQKSRTSFWGARRASGSWATTPSPTMLDWPART